MVVGCERMQKDLGELMRGLGGAFQRSHWIHQRRAETQVHVVQGVMFSGRLGVSACRRIRQPVERYESPARGPVGKVGTDE